MNIVCRCRQGRFFPFVIAVRRKVGLTRWANRQCSEERTKHKRGLENARCSVGCGGHAEPNGDDTRASQRPESHERRSVTCSVTGASLRGAAKHNSLKPTGYTIQWSKRGLAAAQQVWCVLGSRAAEHKALTVGQIFTFKGRQLHTSRLHQRLRPGRPHCSIVP